MQAYRGQRAAAQASAACLQGGRSAAPCCHLRTFLTGAMLSLAWSPKVAELTVPSESLTSRVANSQLNSGKLMLKFTLSRSPCALLSTTSDDCVSRER